VSVWREPENTINPASAGHRTPQRGPPAGSGWPVPASRACCAGTAGDGRKRLVRAKRRHERDDRAAPAAWQACRRGAAGRRGHHRGHRDRAAHAGRVAAAADGPRLDLFLAAIGCEVVSLTAFGLSPPPAAPGPTAPGRNSPRSWRSPTEQRAVDDGPVRRGSAAVVFSYRQFRLRGLSQAITSWALPYRRSCPPPRRRFVLVAGSLLGGASLATAIVSPARPCSCSPAVAVLLALRDQRVRAG